MTGGVTAAAADWLEVELGRGVRGGFTGADANLSGVVGDGVLAAEHRRALAGRLGAPLALVRQVHGAGVRDADPRLGALDHAELPEGDALVTNRSDVAVGVLVADCVPVLLADPGRRVVAAVHAGRRGLVAGVLEAAVDRMVALGARVGDVRAVIGPAVCGRCYEVPEDMREDVARAVRGTASTTSWGTPALDLPAGVRGRLLDAGVGRVGDVAACTVEDARWFSHRASSASGHPTSARPAGRFGAVVRLLPDPPADAAAHRAGAPS
ncbi:peptidoglycan editing factor PgeF [Actinotalea sp. JY-7885]|uniref:peptidoglycan editing factor PgeF n=1 Tax=Actinotalea sp. JY-7885 TaxID=2758576 RepID=UPI00165DDE97|nr:peptidoglycan editing factor PgeF [Actinotalea sp. JY-7885]